MTAHRRKASHIRGLVLVAVIAALTVACVWWGRRHGIGFSMQSFLEQVRHVTWWHIGAGVALIYGSYFLRSYRWAVMMKGQRNVPPFLPLGPQFTGFTAVAIFGRIADLSRPYLVARKAAVSLPGQIAVYTIERMFDLGAAAMIFSTALLFTSGNVPHREIFVHVGWISFGCTVFLATFAVAIRIAGLRIASTLGRAVARLSASAGATVEEKILGFRHGLEGIRSVTEALWVALLSVVQWILIARSYVEAAHAFTAEPTLAHLTFASTMLLMGASIGSSVLQLPVLGWFTQIGATAASMRAFYNTPLETATACGALLLFVNILCIIPAGLVYARIDGVSLTDLKQKSETVEENFA